MKLAQKIHDFLSIDSKSWNHAKNHSYRHSNSLNDKFLSPFHITYPTDLSPVSQIAVANLSNTILSELQCSVLKLNSNFAISKQPSFPQLIAPIEKALKNSRLTDTRQYEFQYHKFQIKSHLSRKNRFKRGEIQ